MATRKEIRDACADARNAPGYAGGRIAVGIVNRPVYIEFDDSTGEYRLIRGWNRIADHVVTSIKAVETVYQPGAFGKRKPSKREARKQRKARRR